MAVPRLQTIAVTNESLQVTYIEEGNIYGDSGIVIVTTIDLPHHQVPQGTMDELLDIVIDLRDHVRVLTRQAPDEFTAPR